MLRSSRLDRFSRLTLGLAALVALMVVGSVTAAAQATAAVNMTEPSENNYAFTPNSLQVTGGTVVVWTNKTDAPHTVTSDTGAFSSTTLTQNQVFKFTFTAPGSYAYHCTIHPYMKAVIVVSQAASAPTPTVAPPTVAPTATAAAPAVAPTSAPPAAAPAATPKPAPAQLPSTGEGGGSRSVPAGLAALALIAIAAGAVARRAGSRR